MDFQGGQDKKNGKFQGDHVKFDWKFKGVNFKKKSMSLTGGVQFFSGKSILFVTLFLLTLIN